MVRLNIIDGKFRQIPFDEKEPFIEVTDEEFSKIIDGELIYNGKKLVANNKPQIIAEIQQLKAELQKAKEDVEQVELFGMEREDFETKKQRCAEIVLRLRVLEAQLRGE